MAGQPNNQRRDTEFDAVHVATDVILRMQAGLARLRQSIIILSHRDVIFPKTIDQTNHGALLELEVAEWYLTNPTTNPGSILIPLETYPLPARTNSPAELTELDNLSDTDRKIRAVVLCLANGLDIEGVAEVLGLNAKTTSNYATKAMTYLKVRHSGSNAAKRANLIHAAWEAGWFTR